VALLSCQGNAYRRKNKGKAMTSMREIMFRAVTTTIKDLDLGPAGLKWLERTLQNISLETLRGADTSALPETLLSRQWPQANLTAIQRDGILSLLLGADKEAISDMILVVRHAAA
jgi:hypothetical protein